MDKQLMKPALALFAYLAIPVLLCSQVLLTLTGGGGYPPITIGIHGQHNNGASAATSVVLSGSDWSGSNATPTAGSTLYCEVKGSATLITWSVTDNVNPGAYKMAVWGIRDPGHSFAIGSYYMENVIASPTTITFAGNNSAAQYQTSCKEFKGVPKKFALDGNLISSQAATGTNFNSGTSITPTNNNEIVLGTVETASTTPTAGSGFTLLDGTSRLFPQYSIQTTKTATTAPFTDASSVAYAALMAGFAKNTGGFCDANIVVDWSGGTNGNTVTVPDLQASTFGSINQPNADLAASLTPAWRLSGSGTGMKYATSAYKPLVRSRNCPPYSGSGTTAAAVGITKDLNTAASQGANLWFTVGRNEVSANFCVSTDIPMSGVSGTFDVLTVSASGSLGNSNFANFIINSNGSTTHNFALEATGNSSVFGGAWTTNADFWVSVHFLQSGGNHRIEIYTGCAANPTLLTTINQTSNVSGSAPASFMGIFQAANTFTAANVVRIGPILIDSIYGLTILP